MKVDIVIPPRPKGSTLPLDSLYLASVLSSNRNEVSVIDLTHCQGIIPTEKLSRRDRIYWIVSNGNYNRAMQVKGFIDQKCLTIISGTDPTMMPEILIRSGWDFVLVGEPELAANGVVSNVFGRGIIHCQVPEILDDLPMPARHSIKMMDYYGQIREDSVAVIQTSRKWKKPRTRSISSVLVEIKELISKYKFSNFKIDASLFLSGSEDIKAFCKSIAPLKCKFEIEIQVDKLNDVSNLCQSGIKRIKLLESSDERNYSELIRRLTEEGIQLYGPGSNITPTK